MNSRERVISALNHHQPDKIPIDFGGHQSSGIMVQAYRDLRRAIGLRVCPLYIWDFIQQLAMVEKDVLDLFVLDVVNVGDIFLQNESYWKDWQLPDGTPCKIPAYIPVEKTPEVWVVR